MANQSADVDELFDSVMDLEKEKHGIPLLERTFDDTLQMIDLFKANAYDVIKYKIKELRNAAFVAMKMLKSMNELDKNKKHYCKS